MQFRHDRSRRPHAAAGAGEPARARAVVVGGSIAGLLAARVLSEHFEEVAIVERDACASGGTPRKGVPQGRHAHVLLASGARVLEQLFPGFSAELVARGAVWADAGTHARVWLEGSWLAACDAGLFTLVATRPRIEAHVRAAVLQRSNVYQLLGREGCGLRLEGDAVVALRTRDTARGLAQELRADFVVDASGRGSRLSRWLSEEGFEPPAEEGSQLDVGYTTCVLPRRAETRPAQALVISPHPDNPRGGLALPVEDDRWIVTLAGYRGDHPPAHVDGFREFAASLPSPALLAPLQDMPADAELVRFHYRRALRRRFERLTRLPRGVIAMGDAFCSFNPVYAQGMSVVALEAQLLDRCLARLPDGAVERAFFSKAARLLDVPWRMVAAADARFTGQRAGPMLERLASAYLARLQRAGARDPSAARAVLQAMHMVAPPHAVFAPTMLVSACRFGRAPT